MKLDRATFVNGTNPVDTAGFADLTVWRQYRVIVNGASSTAVLYTSTDGDVNNGNGDNVAFASTNMGGSGAAGEITGIGFNIGSLGGSSTTLANFDLDWFRVETGTSDPQAHWDLVPEPATLGLLALGCVPLVMRRRR